MTKIKICGLSRSCDIDFVNEARPDYCGFVIGVPKSRRNVSFTALSALRSRLREEIQPVGVFVNAPAQTIISLAENGTLDAVQLHGQEDESYIKTLRNKISLPIIKAFKITGTADLERAMQSSADLILLDNGDGGTGTTFDWSHITGQHSLGRQMPIRGQAQSEQSELTGTLRRPYLLAGGLRPDNLAEAIRVLHPWGVDMSSGVETDGVKDREKILAAVAAVRR